MGQLIENKTTNHAGVGAKFVIDKLAPILEAWVWIFGSSATVSEEKIGVDVTARHKSWVALSSPGSVDSSQSPPRMPSISSLVALPASPARPPGHLLSAQSSPNRHAWHGP